jgi:hypothetical protein
MAKKRTHVTKKKKPSKRKTAKKSKRNSRAIQVASVTAFQRTTEAEKYTEPEIYWQRRARVAESELSKIKTDLSRALVAASDLSKIQSELTFYKREWNELRDFRDTREEKLKEEARVRDWNVRYPTGTPVTITLSDGTPIATKTYGEAFRHPPSGRAHVYVELGGYVLLENAQVTESKKGIKK